MEERTPQRTLPYASYRTFRTYLDSLKQIDPSRVDRTAMKQLSGYNQIAVMGALRHLGLIDSEGIPTDSLRALLGAQTVEDRQRVLRGILERANNWMRKFHGEAPVRHVQHLGSDEDDLLQLVDVLSGATGSDWNKKTTKPEKLALAAHIAQRLKRVSLRIPTTPKTPKFNIWEWLPEEEREKRRAL